MNAVAGHEWWREAVFYQIYPRSFQDSDGDGIGDLRGIIDRLGYLEWLGVDALWLSPTFPSPMKDYGYDVSDYLDVHPEFGTLQTMDELIDACHRRGMRLLLDYVPNHTSDQHPWFIESRASRDAAKRDWYVWRDPAPDGSEPNNWRSVFGGRAWTFDETTGQYYLHSFLREQPDLNWRNPEVVAAMHDVLRFWLGRGIDGFRIDVLGRILKHRDLPDNPENPAWTPGDRTVPRFLPINNHNYPEVYDAVRGIRRVLDEFPGSMAVGEVFGTPAEIGEFYGGEALDGIHLAFNFQLIADPELRQVQPWNADVIRDVIQAAEECMPGGAQPCYALNNHDRPRLASRHDQDGRGQQRARAAALLLLGLRGTPFLYYGEEIGMGDVDIPEDRLLDPARIRTIGRDPCRTPMQWDRKAGRGFTTGEPWLPFGPIEIDVESQRDDPASILSLYRQALAIRRAQAALRHGAMVNIASEADVVSFERTVEGDGNVFVAVSASDAPARLRLPAGCSRVLIATAPGDATVEDGFLVLRPLAAAWVGPEAR